MSVSPIASFECYFSFERKVTKSRFNIFYNAAK